MESKIDLSPEMVRLCRQKGLATSVMDMAELDFSPASFGAIAMNSLLHLPKTALPGVLRQIHRVLKPDGLFYLGVHGGTG
ncbi:MAG: class I SAM-dependent methyltransferase [Chloroflexota bacterium]